MFTCFLARYFKVLGIMTMFPQLNVCFFEAMYFEYVVSRKVMDVTYCRLLSGSLNIKPPVFETHILLTLKLFRHKNVKGKIYDLHSIPGVYWVVEEGEPGIMRHMKSSACCLN